MGVRDQTNPMSSNQIEDYYMRWREVALVVAKRGGILVCNQRHEAFFRDLVARLIEDPWWRLQNAGIDLTMMAHEKCPEEELLIHYKGELLRMSAFLGTNKGFGQFGRIMAPTSDGVVDFGDAFKKLKG